MRHNDPLTFVYKTVDVSQLVCESRKFSYVDWDARRRVRLTDCYLAAKQLILIVGGGRALNELDRVRRGDRA